HPFRQRQASPLPPRPEQRPLGSGCCYPQSPSTLPAVPTATAASARAVLTPVDLRQPGRHGPALPAAGAVVLLRRGRCAPGTGAPPAGAIGDVHPAARRGPPAGPGCRLRLLRHRLPLAVRRLARGVRPDAAAAGPATPAAASAGGFAGVCGAAEAAERSAHAEPLPRRRLLRRPLATGRRGRGGAQEERLYGRGHLAVRGRVRADVRAAGLRQEGRARRQARRARAPRPQARQEDPGEPAVCGEVQGEEDQVHQ
ncbi:Transcription factor VIP1, partial [Zea mays]